MSLEKILRAVLALTLGTAVSAAHADNPVNGAALYATHCASCHGTSPLTSNSNKIYNGRNTRAVTDAAITNVGDMRSLRSAFPAGGSALADLAAYLGNTPTSLGFGSVAVGGSSAASNVTVYASLKAGNSISSLSVATTGDFARGGGTCGTSVATGTNCTIGIVFAPSAGGARSGTLTITHGHTLTPIVIALSGTGTTTSAPAASITPATLGFASTAIGATSASQNITVSNTGNAPLSLTSASFGNADFLSAGGACAFPGSVAAGSSCTLAVAFRPSGGATGARSGSLSITHNAAGSPSTVGLSGIAGAAAAPSASLTPSLAFGSVNVGSTSSAQVATLSNSGTAALAIGAIGTGSTEFAINGGTCAVGGSVAAGSNCTINLSFAPSAAGARSATLTVGHNAGSGSSTGALSGTGVALTPAVSISPASLSFTQTVNTPSAAQTVTVSNTGTSALALSTLALSGAQAGEFQIASGGTCSAGGSVPASGSCTVRIVFTPTAIGGRSATLSITHNASGSPSNVALSGTGTSAPQAAIALNATTLGFASQVQGTPSAAQSVTVTNSGAAALTFGSFTLTGSAASDFTRSGSCAPGAALAAGASCSVSFTFTPGATGSRSATLTIASDASNGSAVLSLAGTGAAVPTPAVSLTPSTLDLGNQTVGSASSARNVTLANTGSGALSIASIVASAGFSVTHNCGTSVAAGANCTLAIGFAPGAVGPATGTVSVASNAAGSPHAVALAGNGVVASPVLVWSPAPGAVDFGTVAVGASATARNLTLVNQGPGPVTLQQITLAGAQAGDFAFGSGSTCAANLVLAANASCTLALGFQPGAAGARAATLHVASNGTNPADVSLAGTGSATAQASASVTPTALSFSAAPNTAAAAQELQLQNSGNAVLRVTALRVAAGSFAISSASNQACQAVPFDLMPGQTCRVAVTWSSTAAGSETGAIEIDSNASATPVAVPLSAARADAAMSNVGAGGCSIAGRGGAADPTLWLLVVGALAVLWRRRRGSSTAHLPSTKDVNP